MNEQRQLFGGTITSYVPYRFDDVSTVREIPDHQEVFADATSDQSIIIEILTAEQDYQNEESIKFHFQELANSNDSIQTDIKKIEKLSTGTGLSPLIPFARPDWVIYTLYGTQTVSKFKEEVTNIVNIYLCLIRIAQYNTDILISLNDPVVINPESSSQQHVTHRPTPQSTMQLFQQILASFHILDYNLFSPD